MDREIDMATQARHQDRAGVRFWGNGIEHDRVSGHHPGHAARLAAYERMVATHVCEYGEPGHCPDCIYRWTGLGKGKRKAKA